MAIGVHEEETVALKECSAAVVKVVEEAAPSAHESSGSGNEPPQGAVERCVLCGLAFAAGAGQAVQAGVNVSMASTMVRGGEDKNVLGAGLVSFIGGWLMLVVMNAAESAHAGKIQCSKPQKWYEVLGGLIGTTVMTCTLLSTPEIGFALASVMRVAGTQLTATTFDHIGLLGMQQRLLNPGKAVGLLVVLAGAMLSVSDDIVVGSSLAMPLLLVLCLLAATGGALLPLQASVNRKLCDSIGNVKIRATLVSFTGGVLVLAVECWFWMSYVDPSLAERFTLQGGEWWMYTGGSYGVYGVTMNIYNPPRIGMATHFMFVIAGNLMASMLLDAYGAFGVDERLSNSIISCRCMPVLTEFCGMQASYSTQTLWCADSFWRSITCRAQ